MLLKNAYKSSITYKPASLVFIKNSLTSFAIAVIKPLPPILTLLAFPISAFPIVILNGELAIG